MATAPNPEAYGEQRGLLTVAQPAAAIHEKLKRGPGMIGMVGFGIVACDLGFIYSAYHLLGDLSVVHSTSIMPYVLLGVALLVASGV
jgi:inorganic phosphate transporter, PiT family